jgi:hypothetical protein
MLGRIGIQQVKRIGAFPPVVPEVDDLAVGVLTGARPGLLARTLDSLAHHAGARLGKWRVLAFVNGADDATLAILRARPWVEAMPSPGEILPIGPAVSALMLAIGATGRSFVLHLEDDWCCVNSPRMWLDRAVHALQEPSVGQVRLRLASEKVMRTNMRTGAAIRWEQASTHHRSSNAHFTFNPHLVRAGLIGHVYPCSGELDAQRRFAELGQAVVQILPGSFSHAGGGDSLRQSRGLGHDQ